MSRWGSSFPELLSSTLVYTKFKLALHKCNEYLTLLNMHATNSCLLPPRPVMSSTVVISLTRLVGTEMCRKCKACTRFQRLSAQKQNMQYLIGNFFFPMDYMLKYFGNIQFKLSVLLKLIIPVPFNFFICLFRPHIWRACVYWTTLS